MAFDRVVLARARMLALVGFIVLVDQLTKALVVKFIPVSDRIDLLPGIGLVSIRNTGVAFGIFGGASAAVIVVITLFVITFLLMYFFRNSGRPYLWIATGLLEGGAISNMSDRVRDGAVIDFISLPHWPAFNVADISITVGVIVLALSIEGIKRPS